MKFPHQFAVLSGARTWKAARQLLKDAAASRTDEELAGLLRLSSIACEAMQEELDSRQDAFEPSRGRSAP